MTVREGDLEKYNSIGCEGCVREDFCNLFCKRDAKNVPDGYEAKQFHAGMRSEKCEHEKPKLPEKITEGMGSDYQMRTSFQRIINALIDYLKANEKPNE